jgi:hypothetical protein
MPAMEGVRWPATDSIRTVPPCELRPRHRLESAYHAQTQALTHLATGVKPVIEQGRTAVGQHGLGMKLHAFDG